MLQSRNVGYIACLISRQESLEEYELADLLLVESEKAADSFRVLGFPNAKLYSMPQGVDVNRFQPGPPPPLFRAVFAESRHLHSVR